MIEVCASTDLACRLDGLTSALDTFWLIFAGSLVFFMQCGFAMLCVGSVRTKNTSNILIQNLLDACGGALGFFCIGFAFAFGDSDSTSGNTFIGGRKYYFLMDMSGTDYVDWFFQFAFAAATATIVAGAVAERCKMAAYLCYSTFLLGVVYPVVIHMIWSPKGFLSSTTNDPFKDSGMLDFAGGGVVHLTGGVCALISIVILGPRVDRFFDRTGKALDSPATMPVHSVTMQMLGSLILWVGWYGFNSGSTLKMNNLQQAQSAALCVVTTTISAASGCVSAMFLRYFYGAVDGIRFFDLTAAMNGALSGLVAITAGCSIIQPQVAVVVGIVSGAVYLGASNLLIKFKIDDVVDAVPVHMANGIWSCMSVGLFADPGLIEIAYGRDTGPAGWMYEWGRSSGDFRLMTCQLCGIMFIIGWVTVTMVPYFLLLQWLGWFRVHQVTEDIGLDLSSHGTSTYTFDKVDSSVEEKYAKRLAEKIARRKGSSGGDSSEGDHSGDSSEGDQSV